jgi:hypothetical protein
MMDLKELVNKFNQNAAELRQFGSTNEARLIQGLAEDLYQLALEVKRIDDVLSLAFAHATGRFK